jgi:hypothetical protein
MIVLTAAATFDGRPCIEAVKGLATRFPGSETLQIAITGDPRLRLSLGPAWRVAQCTGLLVALSEFGDVEVVG